jgi:shikimate kinase
MVRVTYTMAQGLSKTVVMVGMMGAGKTAIGRVLAQLLDEPFVDSDAEIETAAQRTIAEIFERDGEDFFRQRETEVIDRLLTGPPCILSTGGGAFLASGNRDLISKKGVSIWLDVPIEVLWERVRYKDTRPLLRTENPRATLSALFDARVGHYRRADVHVECGLGSIAETASGVQSELLAYLKD